MSWRTHPATQILRNIARQLRLTALIGGLRARGSAYEESFQSAMLGGVRPGDVVWDVGANIGHYTRMFAEGVGSGGKVFAFEPSPVNLERLRAAVAALPQVTVLPFGLATSDCQTSFLQGEDDIGATSRVVSSAAAGAETVTVQLRCGAALVADGTAAAPNMLKIDTEGFELDVLQGIEPLLADPALHTLCIEVHFTLLQERGLSAAPRQIETMLRRAGFKVSWPDMSHIVATR